MLSPLALFILSVTAAAVPTLFYVLIIYWVDRYEKEPWWLLTAAFLWGAVPSIAIAFVFNSLLSVPLYQLAGPSTGDTLAASLIAPPVEESLKGLALLAIFLLWRHEIDSPLDGIIYGAMVGMGFAMVENVTYFITVYNQSGLESWGVNIMMRAVVFGLNHAMFSSITGLGIALARMRPERIARIMLPIVGWMGAIFLHFLHNLSVSFGNLVCLVALITDWGGVGLTLAIIVLALLQERKWIEEYLAEEVRLGTLTMSQYETVRSGRRRAARLFDILTTRGPRAYLDTSRFYRRCSELAYKKHHHTLFNSEKSGQRIEKARQDAVELRRKLA